MRLLRGSWLLAGLGIFLLWLATTAVLSWRSPIQPRATLPGTRSSYEVRLLAFSPDGRTLALTDERTRSLHLWDVASGQERFSIPVEEYIPPEITHNPKPVWNTPQEVAFSPDSQLLALRVKDTLTLWAVQTGQQRDSIPGRIGNHAFSPDGRLLAGWVSPAEQLKLWEVSSGREVATLPARNEPRWGWRGFRFSPSGKMIALAGRENGVTLWKVDDRKETARLQGNFDVLEFSPSGDLLALGDSDVIRLYDAGTGVEVAALGAGPGEVKVLTFAPGGRRLASVNDDKSGWREGTLRLWDIPARREEAVVPLACHFGGDLAFGSGGEVLAWNPAVVNEEAVLWSIKHLPPRELYRGGGQNGSSHHRPKTRRGLALTPDSRLAVAAPAGGKQATADGPLPAQGAARIDLDVEGGKQATADGPLPGWLDWLFGPRREKSRDELCVLNVASGEIGPPFGDASDWLLSPDGKMVATHPYEGSVELWDVTCPPLSFARAALLGLFPPLFALALWRWWTSRRRTDPRPASVPTPPTSEP